MTGNENQRKYLLNTIRDAVHKIHKKWFKNIQADEMIPCHCSYCADLVNTDTKFFAFSTLQRAQAQHRTTIECDKQFEEVSVHALLEGIEINGEISHAINPRREITENTNNSLNVNVNVNQMQPVRQPSATTSNPPQQTSTKETPWYKEWFVITLATSLIAGIALGLYFWSLEIGALVGIATGFVVSYFNPKRRFIHLARFLLIFMVGISATPPLLNGFVKTLPHENDSWWLEFALNIGHTSPWLIGFLATITLMGSLFLFWLDHKQN
ncbi:MAG: hypothetical protein ACWA5U_04090 [bacterium]